jgi:hypothetical protein
VYAYKGKWDHYLEVKEVMPHTCTLDRIDARHRNIISADFVASHMYPTIAKCTSYEPNAIIYAIEEKFGYIISYGKGITCKEEGIGAYVWYL